MFEVAFDETEKAGFIGTGASEAEGAVVVRVRSGEAELEFDGGGDEVLSAEPGGEGVEEFAEDEGEGGDGFDRVFEVHREEELGGGAIEAEWARVVGPQKSVEAESGGAESPGEVLEREREEGA